MPSFTVAAATVLLAAASVAAHGEVVGVYAPDGTFYKGFDIWDSSNPDSVGWATSVTDDGFVGKESYDNFDIACHRDSSPGAISVSVAAGEVLTLEWSTWPKSHHGPVLDYLAPCGTAGCSTAQKEKLEWFKISEVGIVTPGVGDSGVWGADLLIANSFKWQVQIPEGLAAGEYVLRHEIISLHELGAPQHYPQCVNVKVTSDGGDSVPSGILATELYAEYVDFNIYQPFETYPIPGPAMIAGASPILDQGSGVGLPAAPIEDSEGDFEEGLTTGVDAPAPTPTAPVGGPGGVVVAEPTVTAAPTRKPCSARRRNAGAQN
ncbi:related to endoglucanase IV precursor [Cephalotrichum gorgonifer]|uniref:lytic cellulose monooxygenase (C4-dehydrogenating) n=1 Tax=Cephalotrichum gorgonifer TaxID=2041049 RepID=A0AAE8N1M3_9PEZI|nr:related to endoglucanase IV precursor [Cephalotrichum gorgonifer]